jgi:hypothetical protein
LQGLKTKIKSIQPDVIVGDNGLKAYLIPFILKDKHTDYFECHGSKYIEETQPSKYFFFDKKLKYFKGFSK